MELKFYINTTEIIEPIGFDEFQTSLKRTEEHGVSVENSVDSLEFFGNAYGIVKSAYQSDIDTELTFKAQIKCNDDSDTFETLYEGVIDLSTYEENTNDYCSCSAKVAEIGAKTTFNNRTETEISLIDGVMNDLDSNVLTTETLSKTITIPSKGLKYGATSINEDVEDATSPIEYSYSGYAAWTFVKPFGFTTINEITGFSQGVVIVDQEGHDGNDYMFFTAPSNYSHYLLKGEIKLSVESGGVYKPETVYLNIGSHYSKSYTYPTTGILTINEVFDLDLSLNAGDKLIMTLGAYRTGGNGTVIFKILTGSNIDISMIDIISSSTAKVIMPYQAFKKITKIISGLEIKSNWYNNISGFGGGALKGLLTGLQLRNAPTLITNPTLITSSFKDLFINLKCIDNLGYGFSVEDNILYVRIENWKWFYNSNDVLTINNPSNKRRICDTKNIYSRLKIGYDKYAAIEDINTIDTFHTERNYTNKLKAVDNEFSAKCKYIADPYSIEFTRRKCFDLTTKDWKYDDNIFVIAMSTAVVSMVQHYYCDKGITDSDDTVISPETLLNFRISPYKNACRFTDIIKQSNLSKEFYFNSGTGNIKAKGKPKTETHYTYLSDISESDIINENDDLTYANNPINVAELITFDAVLSKTEYDLIKADPYGIITVDGEETYLSEVTRKAMTGECSFKVIPKA